MANVVAVLQQIPSAKIHPNPDNPRLIFREDEMQELMDSINEVGIKVPLSLYQDGDRYVLIDGERRWKCAKRLNLREIPAIVQQKPTKLENLLMMFNIHNVRVDWDPMPMALKLREVRDLLVGVGQLTNPKTLSTVTGVPLASVRRALDLLDLPSKYQHLLLKESEKPRSEQRIKADLFIEIYKSLHVIERHAPEVLKAVSKSRYVDSMVQKYVDGTIDNVVAYREVSKIARAELAGVDRREAIPVLVRLVETKSYSVKDAYRDTVEAAYQRRDLVSRLQAIIERLSQIRKNERLSDEMKNVLQMLRSLIDNLLTQER